LEINPKVKLFYWELALMHIKWEKFEKALDALDKQVELMEGMNISDEITDSHLPSLSGIIPSAVILALKKF
jgi:hypothetical protein